LILIVFSLIDFFEPFELLDFLEFCEKSSRLLKLYWLLSPSEDSLCFIMARSISVSFFAGGCSAFLKTFLFEVWLFPILIVVCFGILSLLVDLDLTDFPDKGGLDDGGLFDLASLS
jgi:hypothetical protein